ncbi:MAG TPA: tetratricopeptide repeat protein, partial [Holophaga sp.]|nr:tetratricopeptide repeat protein [Holophaga sp.]
NRAVELMENGLPEEAIKYANLSIKVEKRLSIGWNILGVVEKSLNNLVEAENSFRKAMLIDPSDVGALGNLEAILRETGRMDEAGKLREISHEIRKHDPYFNAFLAEEAMGEGDLDEALRRINTAIKIQPHDPDFHLARARIHLLAGKTDAAIKAIQEAQRRAEPAERARYDDKMAAIKSMKEDPKK